MFSKSFMIKLMSGSLIFHFVITVSSIYLLVLQSLNKFNKCRTSTIIIMIIIFIVFELVFLLHCPQSLDCD